MIKVIFKNLNKSDFIRQVTIERFESIKKRFPGFKKSQVTFTVSMDNSPQQAGPDLFKVKMQVKDGDFRGFILEQSCIKFHSALAKLMDKTHENLTRFQKKKVKNLRRLNFHPELG